MEKSLPFILNGVTWEQISPVFDVEILLKQDFIRVKERPHRKVFQGTGLFLKAYRLGGAELLFGRDAARKEYVLSKALYQKRRAPRPVAYGKRGSWRFFVSKRVTGQSLGFFLKEIWPGLSLSERKKYLKKFSILLKDLADLGIMQPDFHLDNVFLDEGLDDFVLIDLQRAWCKKGPLSKVEACEQLRYVIPPFLKHLSRKDIFYAVSFLSRWQPEIRRRDSRFFLSRLAYKDVRIHSRKKLPRRLNKATVTQKDKGLLVIRSASTDDGLIKCVRELVFERKGDLAMREGVDVIKNSRHTLCLRYSFSGQDLFLKCYRSSGRLKGLSYLFRRPRSVKSWNAAWYLESVGINTINPLFLIQAKNPWGNIYGLVAYPWHEQNKESKKIVKRLLRDDKERLVLFKKIALFVYEMHEKGVFHGDCKITNFVVSKGGEGLCVFDLDSVRICSSLSERCRMKDVFVMARSLGRLIGEKDGAVRLFLKAYCQYHLEWQGRFDEILSRMLKATG